MSYLMTPTEVAGYLQVPLSTMYSWRQRGFGPPAIRVGKHLRYLRADLDKWITERREFDSQRALSQKPSSSVRIRVQADRSRFGDGEGPDA